VLLTDHELVSLNLGLEKTTGFTGTCIGVQGGGAAAPPGLKNFRTNPVFRARASCSKILNDKKYIFNTVNSSQTLFSGQAQVAQKY